MYLKDCLQNDVKCNQLVHKFPLCHQKTSGGVLWCLAVGHWHFWVSWVRGLGLCWLIDWTCSRMSGHSFADFVMWMSTLYCGGGPAVQECRCCEVIYLVYTVFGWVVHVKGIHLNARTEGFRAEHIILTRWWSYLLCLLVFLSLWLIGVYRLFNLKVVLVNRRHCRGLKCHQIQLKNSKNSNGDSIIQIYFSLKWKYFVHYQRISLYTLYRICYLTHNSI